MIREELFEKASIIEQACWFPQGRYVDGSVYTCLPEYWDWMGEAVQYFEEELGGIRFLVSERKKNGEKLADTSCANWWLWTILNELNVSRIRS